MRGRKRGSQMGLWFLVYYVFQVGLDNIPPVTASALGLNVFFFLYPYASLWQLCLSVERTYWQKDWRRLLLSQLHHTDDLHLYSNMVSLIWKGIRLERRLGGAWFLYLLSVFSVLTGVVYLMLEAALAEITQDESHYGTCAVGFSGVLFALKVLVNHYEPGVTYIMGIPVLNHYASWVELLWLHVAAPGSSFVGHLSGILVGLLYVTGPLKALMKTCAKFMPLYEPNYRSSRGYTSSGYSGQRNHGGAPPPYGFHPTEEAWAEELRWRRMRRFDR